jgi:hypothetical protein
MAINESSLLVRGMKMQIFFLLVRLLVERRMSKEFLFVVQQEKI